MIKISQENASQGLGGGTKGGGEEGGAEKAGSPGSRACPHTLTSQGCPRTHLLAEGPPPGANCAPGCEDAEGPPATGDSVLAGMGAAPAAPTPAPAPAPASGDPREACTPPARACGLPCLPSAYSEGVSITSQSCFSPRATSSENLDLGSITMT